MTGRDKFMTTARDVIKKYLSDRHIDYGRGAAVEADGIIAALLSAGYEVLPRAAGIQIEGEEK
jgi:hypothetical protein